MRIDYACRAQAFDRDGRQITERRRLQKLDGYRDESEGSDFTLHMDGALARLALKGVCVALSWNGADGALSARVGFHAASMPNAELLQELTDYVRGQMLDGYGESPIRLSGGVEVHLDGWQMVGPIFVEDGVDVPGPTAEQLLSWAIEDGDFAEVDRLIARGASANSVNQWGNSPLQNAVARDDAAIAAMLLASGADPNHVNVESFGPLSTAAMTGNVAIMSMLMEAGANPDVVNPSDNHSRMTPLAWAANRGHPEAVRLLIDRGANVNAQCASGITPLMYTDNAEVAELLLSRGANPAIQDKQGLDARAHHLEQAAGKERLGSPNADAHRNIAAIIARAVAEATRE